VGLPMMTALIGLLYQMADLLSIVRFERLV
jgi:hypothetical protein